MKLSDYFKVIHPTYVYLKLTPDTSIRNYNSSNIAKAVAHLYKCIVERIKREEKRIQIECPAKVSYMIDIRKDSVGFVFIVPEYFMSIAIEKIKEVWPRVTVEQVPCIEKFSEQAARYQLIYKREDALSLNVNRASNEPLNSIMNVIDIMQQGDRIGIIYNFIPSCQLSWNKQYKDTMDKVKHHLLIDKEKVTASYIVKSALMFIMELIDTVLGVLDDFMGGGKKKPEVSLIEAAADILKNNIELTATTKKKKEAIVIDTQLMVLSESQDKTRKESNAISVCQAFKVLDEDNELVYKRMKRRVWDVTDFKIAGAEINRMSTEECSNLLQLPGRELLQEYNMIKQVDTLESNVPEELQSGVMCIGVNTYKGIKIKAYLCNDREYKNLALTIVGPTRAGKTTLISNLSRDAIEHGECAFLFDFCGNCELSDDVAGVLPKSKVLNINCADYNFMQGLGYNEAITDTDDPFIQYVNAKAQATQLLSLINSINADDKDLTGRMDRYLEAASLVVFISKGPLKDAFEVLTNYVKRGEYIRKIPEQHKTKLEEYVNALKELDEKATDKETKQQVVIGTRISYISGILDRANRLKKNAYMELMLKNDCANNINLVEEIQKPQLICLKMPEAMFETEEEKDIFCTYWLTKIWLSLQIRKSLYKDRHEFEKKAVKVNLFFDELYQVPQTQEFLRSKLSQIAKFKAKPIISCHHLKQIPGIRTELKAANTSYMLLQGCDIDNYNELKVELEPYTVQDLLNLKRYHSLNLLRYEGGYAKFITKLPPPI